ncbi:MAG: HD domain-containing protein [Candidatus Micrarchaeota archaeon]
MSKKINSNLANRITSEAKRAHTKFERKYGNFAPDWDYIFPNLGAAGNYSEAEKNVANKVILQSRSQLSLHEGSGIFGDISRGAHAIVAMHYTSEIADSLKLNERKKTHLRMAALLHDLGHPVFSHEVDRIIEKQIGLDHDEYLQKELRDGKLGKQLKKHGLNPKLVADYAAGKKEGVILTEYADRMSYAALDAQRLFGRNKRVKKVRKAVKEMKNNFTLNNSKIVMKNEGIAKRFFKLLLLNWQEGYQGLPITLNGAALNKAVQIGLKEKMLDLKELRTGDEFQTYNKLYAHPKIHSILKLGNAFFTNQLDQKTSFGIINYDADLREHGKLQELGENISLIHLKNLTAKGQKLLKNGELKKLLEKNVEKKIPFHEFIVGQSVTRKPFAFYNKDGKEKILKPNEGNMVVVLSSHHSEAKNIFNETLKPFIKKR